MLQRLLSDRFQLLTHPETGSRAVYALIVGKNGLRLVEAAADAKGPNVSVSRGRIEGSKAKMDILARELSNIVGRPVVDETGLTREYDFKVAFAPETRPATDASEAFIDDPQIFTALQEQLGLKLESKSEPVQLLVIDRVSKPSAN